MLLDFLKFIFCQKLKKQRILAKKFKKAVCFCAKIGINTLNILIQFKQNLYIVRK